VRRFPPSGYFVGSAVFHYLGPAFAVLLFTRVQPLGVAWLRIVSAAVILGIWRRPWRALARVDRSTRRLVVAMGVVLATMNACFYTAIDHLPLGTVAAIEFLPVIALAALGMRTARNAAALALAAAGVYAVTNVHLGGTALGIALAFANAALFAAYIVAAHRVARSPGIAGIDGLAAAMIVAAVAATPAAPEARHALTDPALLGAGVGVGVSSSVIPYICDQLAMAALARSTYALLVSLLPATATVIGIVVLGQVPTAVDVAGVGLVVVGVALHREPAHDAAAGDRRQAAAASAVLTPPACSGSRWSPCAGR
jgi:inner membrane transporter RhtA